ncbi:MAG: DUF4956 domain-containing protein [Gemmatimonadaceae bacterium]
MSHTEELEVPERGLSLAARRLLAIVGYYISAAIAIALAWRFAPTALQRFAGTPFHSATGASGNPISKTFDALGGSGIESQSAEIQATTTFLALAGALATALPVAWVYSLTRRRRGFEQSMVHIILLLPLAVAGMVVLIQSSLPLAFSLAGIVAVLRFRNSLEDVKDGVYVFIAVSIGMSAAVGAITIGVVTSVVFNVCILTLWWLDFARRPAEGVRGGLRKLARLPKVAVAKAPNERALSPDARTGDEVFASAARAWRRQLQITAEQRIPSAKGRFNASLRIHSSAADTSRPLIEELLQARTKRWALMGIMPGEGGTFTLSYRVRVAHSARADLLDAIRALPKTIGVEMQ